VTRNSKEKMNYRRSGQETLLNHNHTLPRSRCSTGECSRRVLWSCSCSCQVQQRGPINTTFQPRPPLVESLLSNHSLTESFFWLIFCRPL